MAYARRSRTSRSAPRNSRRRSYSTVRSRRAAPRRRSSRASSGGRTIRLVIEQQPLQALARPDGNFQVPASAPKRSIF